MIMYTVMDYIIVCQLVFMVLYRDYSRFLEYSALASLMVAICLLIVGNNVIVYQPADCVSSVATTTNYM